MFILHFQPNGLDDRFYFFFLFFWFDSCIFVCLCSMKMKNLFFEKWKQLHSLLCHFFLFFFRSQFNGLIVHYRKKVGEKNSLNNGKKKNIPIVKWNRILCKIFKLQVPCVSEWVNEQEEEKNNNRKFLFFPNSTK